MCAPWPKIEDFEELVENEYSLSERESNSQIINNISIYTNKTSSQCSIVVMKEKRL